MQKNHHNTKLIPKKDNQLKTKDDVGGKNHSKSLEVSHQVT
jgi:hypothetical protein